MQVFPAVVHCADITLIITEQKVLVMGETWQEIRPET